MAWYDFLNAGKQQMGPDDVWGPQFDPIWESWNPAYFGEINPVDIFGFFGGGGNPTTFGGIPNFTIDPTAGLPTNNGSTSTGIPGVTFQDQPNQDSNIWRRIMNGAPGVLPAILQSVMTGSSASPKTPPFNPNDPTGQQGQGQGSQQGGTPEYLAYLLKNILGGTSAIGNIMAGFEGLNQQDWNNAAKVDVLNWLRSQGQGAQDTLSAINGAVTPEAINYARQAGGNSLGQQQQLQQAIQGLLGSAPGDFSNILSANNIPGMPGAYDFLGGLLGQGSNQLGSTRDFGAPGNVNPLVSTAQQVGIGALLNGGYTPQLGKVSSIAEGLTGGDPNTRLAQTRASQLLSQEPLLPLDQVLSLTKNQSATNAKNQFNTLKRQLMNTTGITGPAIAGGGFNELLSEAGDESLQLQSKALTDALLGQQGLQLQQFGQGANLFGGANQADLSRQGLGLSSMLGADQQGLQRMAALGNLGLGGANSDLSRVLGSANSNTGLLGQLGNITNSEMQSFLQAAGLGLQQTQAGYGAQNNLLNTLLGNAGLGQQGFLGGMQMPNQTLNNLLQYLGNLGSNQVGLFGNSPVNFSYGNFGMGR